MVNYTLFQDVNVTGIEDILSYPSSGDPYFYGLILLAIWVVLTLSSYFTERDRLGKGNFLSSAAVSSLGVIVLAVIGSLMGIIPGNIFIGTLILGVLLIAIWYWKSD